MARLIDADALMKNINMPMDELSEYQASCVYPDAMERIKILKKYATDEIESAPTVDAVPIVRCKDCKHWDNRNVQKVKNDVDEIIEYADCEMIALRDSWNEIDRRTSMNFHCADGERRTEDEDK